MLKLDRSKMWSDSDGDKNLILPESVDLIRRVDLIVAPPDQYPFALVSWTGSKVGIGMHIIVHHKDE